MPNGHCLCGAITYAFEEPVRWTGYCHCESCRRNCAAPVTAFLGVPDGQWRWTGAAPSEYRSSDHATRFFCGRCGTPMAYASTRHPGEIHFYAAGLDDPAAFAPANHFHYDERLPWLPLHDGLPKHPPEGNDD